MHGGATRLCLQLAEKVVEFAKNILDEIGLNSDRLKMVSVCAADPLEFTTAAESLVNDVSKLGPIMKSEVEEENRNG